MPETHPSYVVTRTAVGADVNYQCPCGCDAGFAFDRGLSEQPPESCCCGRTILVGTEVRDRLLAFLPAADTYALDEQAVTMPWGQVLAVALATPPDAEHGSHADGDLVRHTDSATVHDPVCHMDIFPATAAGSSIHDGTTYFFCSRGCKLDFDEAPTAVLVAEAAYDHNQPMRHGM